MPATDPLRPRPALRPPTPGNRAPREPGRGPPAADPGAFPHPGSGNPARQGPDRPGGPVRFGAAARGWGPIREWVIEKLLLGCAFQSLVTTVAIVGVLAAGAVDFFRVVPVGDFLLGTRWTPLIEPRSYGVLPLVCGTGLVVVVAALVALPAGLACAVYLSEYASGGTRSVLKPVLEVLAGIPTVVYGYFALTLVTPALSTVFPGVQVFNAASAGIVVGIMILPMVSSLADDALRSVPVALRQGGYALGATPLEVTTGIVVPGALSGILASFILSLSRAIGETMAVTIAAGATPRLTVDPFESIQTMTSYLVQVSLGDTPAGTTEYRTLFAVGALLFVITLVLNLAAQVLLERFREVYE